MSYVTGISSLVNQLFFIKGKVLPGEADCKSVEIKGKYVVIQTDHKDFKESIINTLYNPGEIRCISDYVVISDEIILVCEMKSNNEGKMKVQLKNTGKLTSCILSMIKQHHKIGAAIPPIKFVCFANIYKGFKQKSKGEKLDSIEFNGSDLFQLPCNSQYDLSQFT